jgi:hypothetical protein
MQIHSRCRIRVASLKIGGAAHFRLFLPRGCQRSPHFSIARTINFNPFERHMSFIFNKVKSKSRNRCTIEAGRKMKRCCAKVDKRGKGQQLGSTTTKRCLLLAKTAATSSQGKDRALSM